MTNIYNKYLKSSYSNRLQLHCVSSANKHILASSCAKLRCWKCSIAQITLEKWTDTLSVRLSSLVVCAVHYLQVLLDFTHSYLSVARRQNLLWISMATTHPGAPLRVRREVAAIDHTWTLALINIQHVCDCRGANRAWRVNRKASHCYGFLSKPYLGVDCLQCHYQPTKNAWRQSWRLLQYAPLVPPLLLCLRSSATDARLQCF